MTVWNALLWSVGILAALVLVCFLVILFEKRAPGENFDERQKLARGNAYRVAFWTGAAYFAVAFAYLSSNEQERAVQIDPALLIYLGLDLEFLVFYIYCMLKRAALPLSGNAVCSAALCGIYGLQNLSRVWALDEGEKLVFSGTESVLVLRLANAVVFFSIAAMYIISYLWKEKEE